MTATQLTRAPALLPVVSVFSRHDVIFFNVEVDDFVVRFRSSGIMSNSYHVSRTVLTD